MNIFVKANIGEALIEVPVTESNTYTRCDCCGAPIQLSLDFVAEHYPNAPMPYKSLTDYFSHGFICERCANEEEED